MRNMFLGTSSKKVQRNGILGLDLCDRYAQISVLPAGSGQPETIVTVNADELPDLPERAEQEKIWMELVRTCFSHHQIAAFLPQAEKIVFCFTRMDKKKKEFLKRMCGEEIFSRSGDRKGFGVSDLAEKVIFTTREECFFAYSARQPEELWKNACMICDLTEGHLRTLLLCADSKDTERREQQICIEPKGKDYPEMVDYHEEGEELSEGQRRKMDQQFLNALGEQLRGQAVDTIYLIGAAFEDDWYETSRKLLCENRRVFLGDNLYSKGACYVGRNRMEASEKSRYTFVSSEQLSANVGLNAMIGGKSVCHPLLTRGTNWYEAEAECAFYLDRDCSFSLNVSSRAEEADSYSSGNPRSFYQRRKDEKEVVVSLDGVPSRPDKATRIHLKVSCPGADVIHLTMEDLGLGELYPATHKIWEEEFRL